MGEVYLAKLPSPLGLSKPCIVKRIHRTMLGKREVAERFVDEMRILSKLSHPNIVNAFEFGESAGDLYLAMEYVEGLDLHTLFLNYIFLDKPFPREFALYILLNVARA